WTHHASVPLEGMVPRFISHLRRARVGPFGHALIYSFHFRGRAGVIRSVLTAATSEISKRRRRQGGDQSPSLSRPAPLRGGSLARRVSVTRAARSAYTGSHRLLPLRSMIPEFVPCLRADRRCRRPMVAWVPFTTNPLRAFGQPKKSISIQ